MRTRRTAMLVAIALALLVTLTPWGHRAFAIVIAGLTYVEDTDGSPVSTPMSVTEETMTVSEAQQEYSFDVPSWAPTGYSLESSDAVVTDFGDPTVIQVTWVNSSNERIILMVIQDQSSSSWSVGTAGGGQSYAEEVDVGEGVAALVTGIWDADSGDWEEDDAETLQWTQSGDIYSLSGLSGQEDDLVDMAETMPNFQ